MNMQGKKSKIAVAAVVAGSIALPAGTAAAGEKTERAIIGALIGGVAGAAVSRNDTQGALIGAAAGAALGAATAKDKNNYRYGYRTAPRYSNYSRYNNAQRYDRYGRYDSRYYQPSYGNPYGYYR
ncbi:glycine zipper 2TM domain-containing protein [Phenylobacterium sp. J426]|uniref:glycine zipper 2TM domain-containing protein n=1 Tax=Phenylobacterium sp. J426 TaxID=2898439 RepID=UPI0021514390|nr:glycine zipper 2TM domain-containing protein [Phenylobacterium sp. J426]MCR5873572.1 glycine zipper 2TM domain-containing protein [Phenylobacterium sp. J426]